MKPAHMCEMLRGQVNALSDLLATAQIDEADKSALLTLVVDTDALCDKIEGLLGTG